MTRIDLLWWAALLLQLLAIPGALLPVLPGLVLLPLGALLWCWAVGVAVAWPVLALACALLLLGWGAALVGLAVVSGMLVSKLAQALLALCGAAGFVVLSLWGPAAAP